MSRAPRERPSRGRRVRPLLLGALFVLLLGEPLAAQPGSPPACSQPGRPVLRDWPRHPQVDPAETTPPALRIVSAAPNVTEVLCALGLREQIVGRTRYCTYPPEILSVPDYGALIDVNVEVLLALKPDLVVVSGSSRSMTDRFSQLKLRVESVPDTSIDDLFLAIRRLGEVVGRPRTAAALLDGIRADLSRADERGTVRGAPRVLLVTGTLSDPPTPPYVAGPGSFYDGLIRRAGGVNAVGASGRAFGPLSLEAIVAASPEVIIELDPDGRTRPRGADDALAAWSKLGPLSAVTARRLHVLTGPEHYVLGPRIAFTYAAIRAALVEDAP